MKTFSVFILILSSFVTIAHSQTVTYDLTPTDITTSEFNGFCGNGTEIDWGFISPSIDLTWTSSGAFTPTSITVQVYETWNDAGAAIPVTLNTIADGSYTNNDFCGGSVITINLSPPNYNVGGSNTISLYYQLAGTTLTWDQNTGGGWPPGVYARVIVNYPLPPAAPVAVSDYESVNSGSIGNTFDVQANDTDANMDLLTTTIISGPFSGGTASILNNDSIFYNPPTSFCGEDTIIYQVCDPGLLCDQDTLFITVIDADAPISICKTATAYLDSTGNASIIASDVDGGSIDSCGSVNLSVDISSFDCSNVSFYPPTSDMIITGAYDGPLAGGTPKGIELYVVNNITDLSEYGIGSANNGGGSDGEEFTFPAISATAGTFIYVASDSSQFNNFFGFNPNYTSGSMTINGDDAIELFHMGSAIDVFGEINVDGSGEPWEYVDGWVYSKNNRTASPTFNILDWIYSGVNELNGELDNNSAANPFPNGTYSDTSTVKVTLTAEDANLNTSTCIADVIVLDTISPWFTNCPSNISIEADATGCKAAVAWVQPTANDNCPLGLSVSSNFNSGDSFPLGTTIVTYTVIDTSGNSNNCSFDIIVTQSIAATATITSPTCAGDSNGVAIINATSNAGIMTIDWGTQNPMNLQAGTHLYTVNDSVGCSITDSVIINAPLPITTSSSTTNVTCNSLADGSAAITVTGNQGSFNENWGVQNPISLPPGTHLYTVTDSVGCSITDSVIINDPLPITTSSSTTNVTCNGLADGSATITVTGNQGSFNENWGVQNPISLPPGTHLYTVTDSVGCSITDSVIITEPDSLFLTANVSHEINGNDGAIDLIVTGGVGGNTFDWDNDGTGDFDDMEDLSLLSAGAYMVTVMDSNGCTNTLTLTIDNSVGIKEYVINLNPSIYPNPSSGSFSIDMGAKYTSVRIGISDLKGRLIHTSEFNNSQFINLTIDAPKAIYILTIVTNDQWISRKLIKQ